MSFVAVRSLLNVSKISVSTKILLANAVSKSFRFDVKNTRTLTRSFFMLSKNRGTENLAGVSSKVPLSNICSCGCSLHTKGDQELAAFLAEEIKNEMQLNHARDLPVLEGFECKLNGADIILTKKLDNEIIRIKANVNHSVDTEDAVTDPNADTEANAATEAEMMKAKPEFTVEIEKGKKKLGFLCTYSLADPDEPSEFNDVFQITEISLHHGVHDDSTYTVAGDIMDGYLYDLLVNYLEERGISNEFAEEMIEFFTSYEHKLYVDLLERMKAFVEK